jgi:hypothetical protein
VKSITQWGTFSMWNPGFDIGKVASQLEGLLSLICCLWIYQVWNQDLPSFYGLPPRFSQVRIGVNIMNFFKV